MHRNLRLWHRHLLTPLLLLLPLLLLFVHLSRSPNLAVADDAHNLPVSSQLGAVDLHPLNRPRTPPLGPLRIRVKAHRTHHQRATHVKPRAVPATKWPHPKPVYPGSAAQQAVAFAFAQLGCPYVWGGTGPCPDGFDCSGLVMEAWLSAGVTIPRTSEAQWALLPHIPMSALQPGDLVIFEGGGHVGMYVGGGMLIDAPQPGLSVEEIPLSTPWYAANLLGAVRP